MGYNTAFMVLNDGWDQCRKNPEQFIEALNEGIIGRYGSKGVGYHGNVLQVMRTAHADVPRLYTSHGNLMLDMSTFPEETVEFATRDEHGRDYVLDAIRIAEDQLKRLKNEIANRWLEK